MLPANGTSFLGAGCYRLRGLELVVTILTAVYVDRHNEILALNARREYRPPMAKILKFPRADALARIKFTAALEECLAATDELHKAFPKDRRPDPQNVETQPSNVISLVRELDKASNSPRKFSDTAQEAWAAWLDLHGA